MDPTRPHPPGVEGTDRSPGRIGLVATIGLGLLAVPRVVLHDLGVDVGPLNLVLVFGPPAAWLWFARHRGVDRPVLPLAGIGLVQWHRDR